MKRWQDRIFAAIFAVLVAASAIGVTWTLRQTYLVYKLRRGVGDTWFLAAQQYAQRICSWIWALTSFAYAIHTT